MQTACCQKGARILHIILLIKLLQDVVDGKAGEIVYDDVAVGSDGFAAVCRGEADDTGAGSAAGGQAME